MYNLSLINPLLFFIYNIKDDLLDSDTVLGKILFDRNTIFGKMINVTFKRIDREIYFFFQIRTDLYIFKSTMQHLNTLYWKKNVSEKFVTSLWFSIIVKKALIALQTHYTVELPSDMSTKTNTTDLQREHGPQKESELLRVNFMFV